MSPDCVSACAGALHPLRVMRDDPGGWCNHTAAVAGRNGAAMLRALTTTLTMTTLALAACGGATTEDLPPLTTAKGDGLDSYEVEDEDDGNRVCETVQEDVPDELKGKGAVKIVLPNGSTYTRCELPP